MPAVAAAGELDLEGVAIRSHVVDLNQTDPDIAVTETAHAVDVGGRGIIKIRRHHHAVVFPVFEVVACQ